MEKGRDLLFSCPSLLATTLGRQVQMFRWKKSHPIYASFPFSFAG